jgi:hypothetical protein
VRVERQATRKKLSPRDRSLSDEYIDSGISGCDAILSDGENRNAEFGMIEALRQAADLAIAQES